MIPDAVIRNLEIVGEAGGKLSEDANEKMPEVPWRRAVGLTNVLIHGYQDVDIETVWRVVDDALQPLLVAFKETPIVRTSDTRSDMTLGLLIRSASAWIRHAPCLGPFWWTRAVMCGQQRTPVCRASDVQALRSLEGICYRGLVQSSYFAALEQAHRLARCGVLQVQGSQHPVGCFRNRFDS
jgi:hypothetical protein